MSRLILNKHPRTRTIVVEGGRLVGRQAGNVSQAEKQAGWSFRKDEDDKNDMDGEDVGDDTADEDDQDDKGDEEE